MRLFNFIRNGRRKFFKTIVVFLICGLLFLSLPLVVCAGDDDVNNVLLSAETLFKSMKEKNYPEVWRFLTAKTKAIIIDDVYAEAVKLSGEYSKEKISSDLVTGGPIAKAYWDSYLSIFNPDIVLEHSTWKINALKKEYAEINIHYKKSENPATLQMFKEDGIWKVGLEETFRTRKLMNKFGY
ncbi:MAG: hypothetical protein ABFD82_01470 [Syntrophaceae bacterium]